MLNQTTARRCDDTVEPKTYASEDYQDVLDTHGITCSMSRRGNCYVCEHDRAAAGRGLTPVTTDLVSLR